jgi:hypothetical protein
MITKTFGIDFNSSGGALTLTPSEVTNSEHYSYNQEYEMTHPDGWTIKGVIWEDYYTWVNAFEAVHPIFGKVWGDFEKEVFADTEEGFNDFYSKHTPEAWDYGDI